MLADYFMTVWGAILAERKYRQHFKIEHYELNPLWQKHIRQKKWFNPKHLALVALMTAFCFLLSSGLTAGDFVSQGLFGYLTILFASVIGTHLNNILLFSYLDRNPGSISGEVTMSHTMMLSMAQFRVFGLLFVLGLLAIFSPTPFVIGGLLSQVAVVFVKWAWLVKAKAAERKKSS